MKRDELILAPYNLERDLLQTEFKFLHFCYISNKKYLITINYVKENSGFLDVITNIFSELKMYWKIEIYEIGENDEEIPVGIGELGTEESNEIESILNSEKCTEEKVVELLHKLKYTKIKKRINNLNLPLN
ncbi:MAG: hypothetical protein HUK04_07510 [Bacteroidaceae bacterium]|uniref:hypothetical protein n=1 Tax=Fusobacterium varium TaxID=856 RepID=UPI00242D6F04|nr:hypothetical protein [Fusobacterium varium]MCF0171606.1 hypothetical protein [Fusobacterium varium]MCF0189319.1 hypothetical protein [Bacteroidaceae bacterium]